MFCFVLSLFFFSFCLSVFCWYSVFICCYVFYCMLSLFPLFFSFCFVLVCLIVCFLCFPFYCLFWYVWLYAFFLSLFFVCLYAFFVSPFLFFLFWYVFPCLGSTGNIAEWVITVQLFSPPCVTNMYFRREVTFAFNFTT